MIKLIACDLDGTVFDDNKNIDTELKDVVDKLKENGILFTVVSGRNRELMLKVIDYFKFDIPYACNNGANIYLNNDLISCDTVNSSYGQIIAKKLYEHNIPFRLYALEDTYCNLMSDFFAVRMKGFSKPFKDYYPELDTSNLNIVKITADFVDHLDLVEMFQNEVNKYPNTIFVKAEDHVYCVNSISANKGNGLQKICESLNIDINNEVMAFGDNENDLPMLEKVKVSVAMDNSDDYLKKQVDYVTLDNNHNGVSHFLKEYFKNLL